ncbi:MAG TPA: hypothetical protein VN688_32055 [Gemmataceae bacterium]|nr:hypothetical protein [Gemmataceae bacterium]
MVFGLVYDEGAEGAFYLFLSDDRAWVHLAAGSCRTARGRAVPELGSSVIFRLDNGEERMIPVERTVAREQGLKALRYWFSTEQAWPELNWVHA